MRYIGEWFLTFQMHICKQLISNRKNNVFFIFRFETTYATTDADEANRVKAITNDDDNFELAVSNAISQQGGALEDAKFEGVTIAVNTKSGRNTFLSIHV